MKNARSKLLKGEREIKMLQLQENLQKLREKSMPSNPIQAAKLRYDILKAEVDLDRAQAHERKLRKAAKYRRDNR